MGLVSLSASAYEYERPKPSLDVVEEVPVAFEVGKTYILYNTGAEMYFTQGSTWATRGCVVPNKASAVLVRVAKYTLNDVWDGKTYEIENYVTPRTGSYSWYKMCMNGAGDLYLDQTTWSRFVELQNQGSNIYRIMPNEVNNTVEGDNGGVVSDGSQFVGYAGLAWDGGGTQYDFGMDDNELRMPLSALTDQNVDWVFYSTAAYDAAMDVYNKAEELKAVINLAEQMGGIDTSAAEGVYENEGSTMEQIIAAINALGEAMAAESGVEITGSAENPGDATAAITNPNFDDASYDGWLGTAPNMVGSGSHGPANVAEHYNHNFDTYQTLFGLPAGVYGLSAYTFYRGQWEDYVNGTNKNAFLYATGDDTQKSAFPNPWEAQNATSMGGATDFGTSAGEVSHKDENTGITYYIPNDPSAGRVYFEKGFYYTAVTFGVTGGSARIGVIKETAVSNDWSVFDTFGLKYYGNEGAASYASWLEDNAAMLYATGAKSSSQYVEAFLGAIEGQKANATDATSANAAFIALKDAPELAALKENIALWGQWQSAVDNAQKYTEGDYSTLFSAMELGDYISEAEYIQDLDNDAIKAEIQKVVEMVEAVLDELKNNVLPGTDVTEIYLVNADFNNGNQGWTDHVTDSRPGIAFSQNICEAYDTNFDMYQEVNNPQVGVYELQLQGFFRMGRDDASHTAYLNGEQITSAGVYINDNKTHLQCIFDDGLEVGSDDEAAKTGGWMNEYDGKVYPNDMTSAAYAFSIKDEENNGKYYMNKAYGLVAEAGETMRLGVGGDIRGANWICWDNFKLIYRGYDADVIAPILAEAAESIDLSKPMGKSVFNKAKAAMEAAKSASDGTSMFKALKAIFAVRSEVESSVAVFAELTTYLEGMISLFNNSENVDAVSEAGEFAGKLQDELDDHKYEDSDVPALIVKIKEFRTKLRLPADYDQASDINPIEMFIIDTPSFDNGEGANSVEGWEAVGYNFGNDENQKAALALEFYNKTFDLNQIIYAVPDGYYQVSAFAFERLNAEAETPAPAYLYAETGAGNFAKELQAHDGDTSVNDMQSSVAAFGEGRFANTINIKVSGGKLRLGIKKETNNDTDWVIMDDFKLTYYGTNSEMTLDLVGITGDVNGDGEVDVADISAIISHMAGQESYPKADVNGDGEVDVADISATISIMAQRARRAE